MGNCSLLDLVTGEPLFGHVCHSLWVQVNVFSRFQIEQFSGFRVLTIQIALVPHILEDMKRQSESKIGNSAIHYRFERETPKSNRDSAHQHGHFRIHVFQATVARQPILSQGLKQSQIPTAALWGLEHRGHFVRLVGRGAVPGAM